MVASLGAALALPALSGCASWSAKEGGRTVGQVIDDKETTKHVEKALSSSPVYKFSDVNVNTFDGVVQLSGFVNTQEQKQKAGEIAQHVQGANQVVNNITVKAETTPTGRNPGTTSQNQNQNTSANPSK